MVESYYLGIDVGTVRVAAASARRTLDDSVVVTQVPLGHRNDHAPAVAFVTQQGDLLFGDTADRRGQSEPEYLIREFTRSVGDEVPLSVGGHSLDASDVLARTVEFVISAATESEGERPAGVTVTHPTAWGPHRVGLLRHSLDGLGLDDVELMTEAEAAARNYEATHPLEAGRSVVTYDLGGTSFHAAVTSKRADGSLAPAGHRLDVDNLGGADLDDLVFRHVLVSCGLAATDLVGADANDALLRLRRECVEAKEALSFDTEVTIPVLLPQRSTKVRLTRSEFEAMIDPYLERTMGAVDDAIDSSGVAVDDVEAIVLVGGSARIPRVAQRLSEMFDRPIVVDQDPKSSSAMGAARGALTSRGPWVRAGGSAPAVAAFDTRLPEESVPAEEADDDTAIAAVRDGGVRRVTPRGRWWAGVALATLTVSGLVLISGTLLSEFGADDEKSSPKAAAVQTSTAAGPSATEASAEVPSSPEVTQTPAAVAAPEPVSAVSQMEPSVRRETVQSYVTTEAYTTVTATPAASQRPSNTPPGQTTSPTATSSDPTTQPPTTQAPTSQAPDPTTPAPTSQAPDPTTPAPTSQAPDPTTPAPDPTTQAPAPTTQAPAPSDPAPPSSSGPEITPL